MPELVQSSKFFVHSLGAKPDTTPELSILHSPLSSSTAAETPASGAIPVSLPVSDTSAERPAAPASGTTRMSLPVSDTHAERPAVTASGTLPVSDTAAGTGNWAEATVHRLNGSTVQRPGVISGERETSNGVLPVPDTKPSSVKLSNRQTVKPLPEADDPEPLQVAPVVIPQETLRAQAAPVTTTGAVSLEIDPASASARTQELVDAAVAVADTILVTPSLVHGEGEVTIRLKPTVLDGSEIRLEARGEAITVVLTPATTEVQRLAEQSQARITAELSERIPSFQIAVVVNPRQTTSRRDMRDETA